jgi:hypothetical protein
MHDLDQLLRERYNQDRIALSPASSAAELFATLDKEADRMSEAERDAEDRLWDDFQRGINETRASLGMRLL